MLIDGKKVACGKKKRQNALTFVTGANSFSTLCEMLATCIKGHRATHCKHKDRPMVEIKKKGRPATQCPRCRELRVVRQLHVKCSCYEEQELKRARTVIDQDSKMINKLVIDISKANLRAIAPRPKQLADHPLQQKPPFISDQNILSPSPYAFPSPRTSSSSPSLSPPAPPMSPCTNLSVVSPSTPQKHDLPKPISLSPAPTTASCCSSSPSSSSSNAETRPVSKCRCRPGGSCGCKAPNTNATTNGSCCGSAPSTSSCCGSSTGPAEPSPCCGPTSSLPPPMSPSSSSPSSSSSIQSFSDNPKSCCSSSSPQSIALSPQSMLYPSSSSLTLPPIDAKTTPKPTMCADGLGKSSCCSSKQRNSLGETIRLVTCRCGDSCACIGCDAHPSRVMKSSEQDPYAGYTDLPFKRRLSIAALCTPSTKPPRPDDMPTSVLAENGALLCGCGCSNTLSECTDCFQELCQDYYAGG
ncbi:hypothetical protein [Absidia glauca]|uniref:Copper-fist domain-containing protein n=1 Tax=Absidia glauca TaxID=4829 RepID=A0A163J0T2_ABSGL|nr:hypothetical protein [Absidia glauca]